MRNQSGRTRARRGWARAHAWPCASPPAAASPPLTPYWPRLRLPLRAGRGRGSTRAPATSDRARHRTPNYARAPLRAHRCTMACVSMRWHAVAIHIQDRALTVAHQASPRCRRRVLTVRQSRVRQSDTALLRIVNGVRTRIARSLTLAVCV